MICEKYGVGRGGGADKKKKKKKKIQFCNELCSLNGRTSPFIISIDALCLCLCLCWFRGKNRPDVFLCVT